MILTKIYRKLVPEKIRKSLYKSFVKEILDLKDLIKYKLYYIWFSVVRPRTDKQKCLYFMGKHFITNYPYDYYFEYIHKEVDYHFDEKLDLPYVLHNSKKLYFKNITRYRVENAYRMLLMEQDLRSAHCYVDDYKNLRGKTILDVGTAEGIFALNAIDVASHLFLFECEKDWIKPLMATFEPYIEKITIVEKYVSNTTEGQFISLDNFFKNKVTDNIFIKMDIEGFERKALEGSTSLFANTKNISGAICAYHNDEDEKLITSYFRKLNIDCKKTNGYIYNERNLRAGVIRFNKSTKF